MGGRAERSGPGAGTDAAPLATLTRVVAQVIVAGHHHWPQAPEAVAHLRARHRHRFFFRLSVPVAHDDRATEFLLLAQAMRRTLSHYFPFVGDGCYDFGTYSCEGLGRFMLTQFPDAQECSVFEDDENGAVVTRVVTLPFGR